MLEDQSDIREVGEAVHQVDNQQEDEVRTLEEVHQGSQEQVDSRRVEGNLQDVQEVEVVQP